MRKIIAYPVSFVLYHLGDLISKPMIKYDWVWLYPIYDRLMSWDWVVDKWGGLGGWETVDHA